MQDLLERRLPRLPPGAQRLANLFYGRRSLSQLEAFGRTLTWEWKHQFPVARAAEMARLRTPHGEAWLLIARDHGFCPDASIDWRGLTDDARLLAWTLSYEPLLAHLRRLLGFPFEPAALIAAGDAGTDATHSLLTFTIRDADDQPALSGSLRLRSDQLDLDPDMPGSISRHVVRLDEVPTHFRVRFAELRIGIASLSTLTKDDVISLGSVRQLSVGTPVQVVGGKGRVRFRATLGADALSIQATEVCQLEQEETLMSSTEEEHEQDATLPDLDALPVTLSFEAGELSLTVAELRALAPGAVLSLRRRLSDSPITVRANGRALAKGELVLIDDFLGVRIVGLQDHGPE